MKLALLIFALCAPLSAQLHFGVKGGGALTDMVDTSGNVESRFRRWVVGPMVDLDLPLGLATELNILYRRTGYAGPIEKTSGLWEFPLVIKYRFPGIGMRPYVGGGWAYRNIGDVAGLNDTSNGFILETGVNLSTPILRISPEIRYTRWDNSAQFAPGVRSTKNQLEFLVGFSF